MTSYSANIMRENIHLIRVKDLKVLINRNDVLFIGFRNVLAN